VASRLGLEGTGRFLDCLVPEAALLVLVWLLQGLEHEDLD
jgi:hypothetical protein